MGVVRTPCCREEGERSNGCFLMHACSSKEGAPGREEILHMQEGENEAAFASSSSLPAPLIIQSALPLLLSASPLHRKGGGGGDERGVFFVHF